MNKLTSGAGRTSFGFGTGEGEGHSRKDSDTAVESVEGEGEVSDSVVEDKLEDGSNEIGAGGIGEDESENPGKEPLE